MAKVGIILPELKKNLFQKPVTREYPFEKAEVAKGYRGVPRFIPDRCVGCKLCVKDCTAEAIEIEQVQVPVPPAVEGEPAPKPPRKFRMTLYLDRCVHCARCAEVCNKDAIFLDEEFEIANFNRPSFKLVTE